MKNRNSFFRMFHLAFLLAFAGASAQTTNIGPLLAGDWESDPDRDAGALHIQPGGEFQFKGALNSIQGKVRLIPPNTLRRAYVPERGHPDSCIAFATGVVYPHLVSDMDLLVLTPAFGIVGGGKSFHGQYHNIIPEANICRDDDKLFSQPMFDSAQKKVVVKFQGVSGEFGFHFDPEKSQLALTDSRGSTTIFTVRFQGDTVFVESQQADEKYTRVKTVGIRAVKSAFPFGPSEAWNPGFNILGRSMPGNKKRPCLACPPTLLLSRGD